MSVKKLTSKKGKYSFTLIGVNVCHINNTYGIKISSEEFVDNKISSNTTKLTDLNTDKGTPEVISFLDESKKIHTCHISMIDFHSRMDVNLLRYHCFWCKNPFDTSPIGCPIKYITSQAEKKYYSHISRDTYTIKENITEKRRDLIKKNMLKIIRINPFDITRNVDAMLAKEKGELLIDIEPVIMPKEFKPEVIVVDSLTAIASAFAGREDSYRIYIEQLFRFFEKLKTTTFLITETKQVPDMYSTSGVEEFLADGVVVLYNIKRGDVRENAVEVLKMRGAKHQKKIVAMQITDKGIVIYPEQEVFGGLGSE